jgi:cytoskeletal protein CcmA (bactofilin family)
MTASRLIQYPTAPMDAGEERGIAIPPRPHQAAASDGPSSQPARTQPASRDDAPDAGKSRERVRTLLVGQGIALSGTITACDRLVVEGNIEVGLACTQLDITPTGAFKGSATVERAEIRGSFDGELTVRGCLVLSRTGRINGTVRYNEIEIERGGQILGTFERSEPAA